MHKKIISDRLLIGRNEWCKLPDLKVPLIKAKIDTGAKTSAIHAFNINPFHRHGELYVSFDVHPVQANDEIRITCLAKVMDERLIMSSNGHKEHRYVIVTKLVIGKLSWQIEVTLSNRDPLRFRMLLGREALNHNRVLINPSISCHQKKYSKSKVLSFYTNN